MEHIKIPAFELAGNQVVLTKESFMAIVDFCNRVADRCDAVDRQVKELSVSLYAHAKSNSTEFDSVRASVSSVKRDVSTVARSVGTLLEGE